MAAFLIAPCKDRGDQTRSRFRTRICSALNAIRLNIRTRGERSVHLPSVLGFLRILEPLRILFCTLMELV
jgi:hypothetical protein